MTVKKHFVLHFNAIHMCFVLSVRLNRFYMIGLLCDNLLIHNINEYVQCC